KTIRSRCYDLAICTNFAPRGAWLAFLAGIPQRIGYDIQQAKWFLTQATPARHGKQYRLRTKQENLVIRHETENQLDILELLGISTNDTRMEIDLNPAHIETMQTKLDLAASRNRPIVLICPLGSQEKKSWTISGTANFIKNISPKADCYLIGSAAQGDLLNKINATAGNLAKVLAGTLSLGELAAFIARANLLVSVDTGPLHIAEALKTPVIALFGPHDPRIWGPREPKSKIFAVELDCSPCWHECANNRCMQEIDETAVIAAAADILENTQT
ncbi:MAG: glycosyltransferase family 9 protein, partial [Sporomusaceae bacterium]|nr:glycosyltransferase family 9 protein [Sporomusaceae bacterium]